MRQIGLAQTSVQMCLWRHFVKLRAIGRVCQISERLEQFQWVSEAVMPHFH
jgi:hypothetical protein